MIRSTIDKCCNIFFLIILFLISVSKSSIKIKRKMLKPKYTRKYTMDTQKWKKKNKDKQAVQELNH